MKKYCYIVFLIALCCIFGCTNPDAGGGTVSPDATEAYIIDAVLCTSIENGSPAHITNFFFFGERVNLWIHWANVRTGQTVTAVWRDPNGVKRNEHSITFQGRDDRQISISYIDMNTTAAGGDWLVEVYLNDKFMRSYIFSVN